MKKWSIAILGIMSVVNAGASFADVNLKNITVVNATNYTCKTDSDTYSPVSTITDCKKNESNLSVSFSVNTSSDWNPMHRKTTEVSSGRTNNAVLVRYNSHVQVESFTVAVGYTGSQQATISKLQPGATYYAISLGPDHYTPFLSTVSPSSDQR